MTLHIKGRTRYADGPTTKISISRYDHDDPIMVIEGALFEFRDHDKSFVLGAKHLYAVDEENDSSYVAYLEGSGFTFLRMTPNGFDCNAAIFKAKFYDEEPPVEERDPHDWETEENGYSAPFGFLSFTPPVQKWEPRNYWVRVEYQFAEEQVEPKDAN